MTPQEFKRARKALGYTQQALANEFDMGVNGGRTIRRWESGQCSINPIVAYTVRLMLKGLAIELLGEEEFEKQSAPLPKQLKSSGAD
jgi:transcriptional regulator with XRE-family HTH domain